VFDNRLTNEENSVANDRVMKGKGYHVVPPPLTGNYMPPKPDLSFAGLDDFIYKFKISETVTSLAKDEKDAPKTSIACVEKPKEDKSIFTKSGRIPVSAAKPKAAASASAAKPVNTAGHKQISAVKGNGVTTVKTSTGYVWRPRVNAIDQLSKQNRWICTRVDYVDLLGKLKSNVVSFGDLTCLFAKASINESNLWHRRLGHVKFKIMNKLVKGNLVRSIPSKIFNNDHSCVSCQKGKQHKATLLTGLAALADAAAFGLAVLTERKNRILIEAARTMLADSLLPVTFWAEAVNTACYVLNRAFVTKTHNKTPYELLNGRSPRLDFMRPFGGPVTILNTLDPLGKFKGKADEGFLVGYSVTSKAFKEVSDQHYIVLPFWSSISSTHKSSDDKPADDNPKDDTGSKTIEEPVNKEDQAYRDELNRLMSQEKEASDAADALRKEFEQGCMDQRRVT
nr:ribonuclease H-like domain-containing protein [Tanacetum cinerariifolium]